MNFSEKDVLKIKTLGELKKKGYKYQTIKEELRNNLILHLKNKTNAFEGILGYEDTVIPEVERAILSKHNINFLGLRGQAKTRIARSMVMLLNEYVPIIMGSELREDPLNPISNLSKERIIKEKDNLPIEWLHRSERYSEKLATPDVSISDLIGDIDPIKAINLKLNYSDFKTIHFGMIPRANRGIFVINELPDLQAKIQVALFNILQEGDIQIRGFNVRLLLDIMFIFTSNPEDYTNRGSIVTPLKDRIGSQILTHYPKNLEIAMKITSQEIKVDSDIKNKVKIGDFARHLIEKISEEAKNSEYVDIKSGVSTRMSITSMENLYSACERRMLINGENETKVRLIDFWSIIPSLNGKLEMVYEGEVEGASIVSEKLILSAIKNTFLNIFKISNTNNKKKEIDNLFVDIIKYFEENHTINLNFNNSDKEYIASLEKIEPLKKIIEEKQKNKKGEEKYFMMELVLFGLAEVSKLSRTNNHSVFTFGDLMNDILGTIEEKK